MWRNQNLWNTTVMNEFDGADRHRWSTESSSSSLVGGIVVESAASSVDGAQINQSTYFHPSFVDPNGPDPETSSMSDDLEASGCYPTWPVSVNAFSTEQICDHLINSNDGWGRKPIDQTTPWDSTDSTSAKSSSEFSRSELTTPTPGGGGGGISMTATVNSPNTNPAFRGAVNAAVPTQHIESSIWTSEVPTGTSIWELHYDNTRRSTPTWHMPSSSQSVMEAEPAAVNHHLLLSQNNIMEPNNATAAVAAAIQGGSLNRSIGHQQQQSWDLGKKPWANSPTGSGRPLLGGSRATAPISHKTEEALSGWCSDPTLPLIDVTNGGGGCGAAAANSWDGPSRNAANNNMMWNSTLPTHHSSISPSLGGIASTDEANRNQQHQMSYPSGNNPQLNDRIMAHPLSHTYRADLMKYLMNQGFKKEDAQAALIECNMDPNRALGELRRRYGGVGGVGAMPFINSNNTQISPTLGAAMHVGGQLSTNAMNFLNTGPTQMTPSNPSSNLPGMGLSAAPTLPLGRANRGGGAPTMQQQQQHNGAISTNPNKNQFSSNGHPNPQQQIRQQFKQQVRSALSFPLAHPSLATGGGSGGGVGGAITPNSTSALVNGNTVAGIGNSLLGQPPPLLNGLASIVGGGASISPPHNIGAATTVGMTNRAAGSFNNKNDNAMMTAVETRFSTIPSSGLSSGPRRSDRQVAIALEIQELQKKHMSIQQQLNMYRNNPTMYSQPQYTDVLMELQNQMHQIEAQRKAKETQLQSAYALAASTTRSGNHHHHQQPLSDNGISLNNPNHINSLSQPPPSSLLNKDQLVQQLMDLRVRPGSVSNRDLARTENDFPAIGTWSAYTKGNPDAHSEHHTTSDVPVPPMSLTALTPCGPKGSQNTWAGNWQPNGMNNNSHSNGASVHRPQRPNGLNTCGMSSWQLSGEDAFLKPLSTLSTGNECVPSSTTTTTTTTDAQWLLVQPNFNSGFGSNLNKLYSLLSQYGLTHFHVINASTASVLVRLRSAECMFQLMQSLSDRLSCQLITDPESFVQRIVNTRSENDPGPYSPTTVDDFHSATPHWGTVDNQAAAAAAALNGINPSTGAMMQKNTPSSTPHPRLMVFGTH